MALTAEQAIETASELLHEWKRERDDLDRIDAWMRWDHDPPHKPIQSTAEYKELMARAQAPWGDLIVGSVAQTLYVEGYRRPDAPEDGAGWELWQANGWDARQIAVHRGSLGYGIAFGVGMPGKTLAGEPMPELRGVSPREMIALYEDPAMDEWPVYALRVAKIRGRYSLWLYDESERHQLQLGSDLSKKPTHIGAVEHEAGVCPVVRYPNRFDLEGRYTGEIEPFIPLLGRIDQTTFDRLVVQRFGAWIIRTIAGMDIPASAKAQGITEAAAKLKVKIEDFLVASDKDTKFGSLPATPLDGFIKSHESDLIDLAAVSQTPAFELLGNMANLSAEALDAAKDSQNSKSDERKHTLGEAHEQLIRLGLHLKGDDEAAQDFSAQVRWADTSIKSLAHAADAFGKLVTQLKIPPQVLWSKIPGFTQQDVDEATRLLEQGGVLEQLVQDLLNAQEPPVPAAG